MGSEPRGGASDARRDGRELTLFALGRRRRRRSVCAARPRDPRVIASARTKLHRKTSPAAGAGEPCAQRDRVTPRTIRFAHEVRTGRHRRPPKPPSRMPTGPAPARRGNRVRSETARTLLWSRFAHAVAPEDIAGRRRNPQPGARAAPGRRRGELCAQRDRATPRDRFAHELHRQTSPPPAPPAPPAGPSLAAGPAGRPPASAPQRLKGSDPLLGAAGREHGVPALRVASVADGVLRVEAPG